MIKPLTSGFFLSRIKVLSSFSAKNHNVAMSSFYQRHSLPGYSYWLK